LSWCHPCLVPALFLAYPAAAEGLAQAVPAEGTSAVRRFEIRYEVEMPAGLAPDEGPVMVWVPLPVADRVQDVRILETPRGSRTSDPDRYGNRFGSLTWTPGSGGRSLLWRYRIERRADAGGEEQGDRALGSSVRRRLYTMPNRLVPVTGPAAVKARGAAGDLPDPIAKARVLYDLVLGEVDYDKRGEGWGRGSTDWACTAHYGNCTDFHAYFISMARSLGIPARFQIGFPLPREHGEGVLSGYHCWAHFLTPDLGWVPVDISEADKHPARAGFYFGHLDPDRFSLSFGRDLVLDPPQEAGPVNFLVQAYAERSGRPISVKTTVRFRDLGGPGAAGKAPAPQE